MTKENNQAAPHAQDRAILVATAKEESGVFEARIEKSIGLPVATNWHDVFRQMEVGDSFVLPENLRNTVQSATANYRIIEGTERRYSIRKIASNRYRCWRVK